MIEAIMDGSTAIKVVAGVVVLIVILLFIAIVIAIILKIKRNKPGLGDKLPLGPMIFMSDQEAVLYDRLRKSLREFDGFAVYPKVSTNSILAARRDVHPKILRKLEREFVTDGHDFVIVNRRRIPVAVIELDSNPSDMREEQARRSGLPIIRIEDPYSDPDHIANKIRPLMK